ncbi:hypothetical protein DUNSADRAFT_2299 [Dunaliella salina]|uniref:Uncharacterized protein n=1 Tax=Dunaliella salina TaxID=3046 RepID=A0ABQ7GVY6_DUNSA|nr:hypothetical protein DUNSADRAFT_2299 [Dunaliella salina]|eukprot:KAF5838755.1 hypothetical protein DUNSADRAFT_2299 [Dunaliella salina]
MAVLGTTRPTVCSSLRTVDKGVNADKESHECRESHRGLNACTLSASWPSHWFSIWPNFSAVPGFNDETSLDACMLLALLLLLEGCALAVQPPDFSNCSTIDLSARTTTTLASGCFRPEDGRLYLGEDLEVIGQPDGSTVLDLEWRAVNLVLGGHVLQLTNISIVRTLPMWRPPCKLVPLYVDSHASGSRVQMDKVTLHMLSRCDILGKVSQAFGDVTVMSEDGSAAFIPYSDSGVARGSSITAACDQGPQDVEQISMETSSGDQLLYNLFVLDQSRLSGTFKVTGANVSLEDGNWPEATDSLPELFDWSVVQGFRSDEAGRLPVLDFGLRPKVMRIDKGIPQLTFKDLILTNLFEQPWSDAAARDPLALLSLSFHGFLMDRSGGAKIVVKDCSIVVSEHELVVFTYWGILVNTDGTPHMDKVAPWITSLRVDRIRITPTEDGNLLIREISELRAVKFENVTLTTEIPDGAVDRIRARDGKFKGDPPAIYSVQHLPLVEVTKAAFALSTFFPLFSYSKPNKILFGCRRFALISTAG